MSDLPNVSIGHVHNLRKVRICPEHMCIVLRKERFWRRYLNGEFRLYTKTTLRQATSTDYKGRTPKWHQEHFLKDDKYPERHSRHLVVKAHCSRLPDGSVSASGLIDPKYLLVGDSSYRQLDFVNPHCAMCESGNMIPIEERFWNSVYKPLTPPLSRWNLLISRIKRWLNRQRDLLTQRRIVKQTMPK
jgi:hypothetical protein